MRTDIEERACDLALYIIEHRGTVRAAAKQFGISKSTVHKDLSQRLPTFNRTLYLQVKEILEQNKAERHIRGGIATRRKYKGEYEPRYRRRKKSNQPPELASGSLVRFDVIGNTLLLLAELGVVVLLGLGDDVDCRLAAVDIPGHGLLALQGLVDAEEVGHLVEDVAGQVQDIVIHVVHGVREGDGRSEEHTSELQSRI